MLAHPDQSVLLVCDLQENFLKAVPEANQILNRAAFLIQAANILQIPTLATVQNPTRMGSHHPQIAPHITGPTFEKMVFSCCGAPGLNEAVEKLDRPQIILIGVETHICITQTSSDFLEAQYEVFLPLDAIASRTTTSTKIATKRLRDLGAHVTHTESVVYEWLQSADHPEFKKILELVKANPPT